MERTKFKEPFIVTDPNGIPLVREPEIGSIVTHTGWAPGKNLEGYPCDVYIVKGRYTSKGVVSNFWYWKKVLVNRLGKTFLGKEESGHGSFHECKTKYKINK